MKSNLRLAIAFAYGPWVALVYIIFKNYMAGHTIECFSVGALLGALLLLLINFRGFVSVLFQPYAWLRSFSFALTQLFIFRSLVEGEASVAFASASVAVLMVLPLSRVVVGSKFKKTQIFYALLGVAGLWAMAPMSGITSNGLLAGLFQAFSIVFAQKAGQNESSTLGNVTLGLLLGGLVCLVDAPLSFGYANANLFIFSTSAALIVSTQLYFVWLTFNFSSVIASQVSQTRIVWSVLIEMIIYWKFPTSSVVLGSFIVLIAAIASSWRWQNLTKALAPCLNGNLPCKDDRVA